MNKDVLLAVFIGFILGILAALAIYFSPKLVNLTLNKEPQQTQEPQSEKKADVIPTIAPQVISTLKIVSPENNSLSEAKTISISGQYSTESLIVITTFTDEAVTRTDGKGNFTAPLKLSEGPNEIVIIGYHADKIDQQKLIVNYTDSEL